MSAHFIISLQNWNAESKELFFPFLFAHCYSTDIIIVNTMEHYQILGAESSYKVDVMHQLKVYIAIEVKKLYSSCSCTNKLLPPKIISTSHSIMKKMIFRLFLIEKLFRFYDISHILNSNFEFILINYKFIIP
jgi:hypothetical protein